MVRPEKLFIPVEPESPDHFYGEPVSRVVDRSPDPHLGHVTTIDTFPDAMIIAVSRHTGGEALTARRVVSVTAGDERFEFLQVASRILIEIDGRLRPISPHDVRDLISQRFGDPSHVIRRLGAHLPHVVREDTHGPLLDQFRRS